MILIVLDQMLWQLLPIIQVLYDYKYLGYHLTYLLHLEQVGGASHPDGDAAGNGYHVERFYNPGILVEGVNLCHS